MYKFDSETKLYLVTGFTDFRCRIDALTRRLKSLDVKDVLGNTAYIFMCKTKNKIKILHWGGTGFWLISYRLENSKFKRIKDGNNVKNITKKQLIWLLDGLEIEPKNHHKEIKNLQFF